MQQTVYFGLGSNLGKRRKNLDRAISMLEAEGFKTLRISPVVESPALLPLDATPDWNRPFLNLVVAGAVDETPSYWRRICKSIEDAMGREHVSSWAPRPMDIDILLWGDKVIQTEDLHIPHRQMQGRSFVLSPFVHLAAGTRIPGPGAKSVFTASRELPHHIPLWMGVLNITPDSFSDGGRFNHVAGFDAAVNDMIESGVHIIDVGAESTRPGATALDPEQEWRRLAPMLARWRERIQGWRLAPGISVDTRHHQVAERALAAGATMINDVSGLHGDHMIDLARESDIDFVAMHNLGVPVDRRITLDPRDDPVGQVGSWLEKMLEHWQARGLDLDRIIFDPGIGFGKDALQSQRLLQHIGAFQRYGLRILVGHSRKSYMNEFARDGFAGRDVETVGASLALCCQHVDILRIHNVSMHHRAYLSWAHLQGF